MIFMMLSSKAQCHMQEFTLGPSSESRSAPGYNKRCNKKVDITE